MKEVSMLDVHEPKNLNEKFENLLLEDSEFSALRSKPKIIQKDYNYLIKNNNSQSQSLDLLAKTSRAHDSHPLQWWSPHKALLRRIFLEHSSDSEDDLGHKLYIKQKDPLWLRDQEEIAKKT
jgi:hypothetical protein